MRRPIHWGISDNDRVFPHRQCILLRHDPHMATALEMQIHVKKIACDVSTHFGSLPCMCVVPYVRNGPDGPSGLGLGVGRPILLCGMTCTGWPSQYKDVGESAGAFCGLFGRRYFLTCKS